jgi:tRNA (guanosine-2'-O-)-methyltransferase
MGSGNWVDLHSHSEGESPSVTCLKQLKEQGYQIVSTSPHTEMTVRELPLDKPIALVFGTEVSGISKEVAAMSDYLVRVPMYGFTESFNISVSAALALSRIRERLENSDYDWRLSEEEQIKLKIKWSTRIVRGGEDVETEIRRRILAK